MSSILVFDRPFTRSFTDEYANLGLSHTIIRISDFKYRDDVGLIVLQYQFLKRATGCEDIPVDVATVIQRDRYLRHLPLMLASRLVVSAWLAIEQIFGNIRPSFFVGLPMDNYYLDLIDQYCLLHKVRSINPVQSFLPGLTRITRRGEWLHTSEPEEKKIDLYLNLLEAKSFRPVWLSRHRTRVDLFGLFVRERIKKVFFTAVKLLKADPYSFHCNGVYPMPGAITVQSFRDMSAYRHFQSYDAVVNRIREGGLRAIVFFPLQFSPESSLDYNIADPRFSRYQDLIGSVLAGLPEDVLLVVKEHPDLYGYRAVSFYDQFKNRENVILADVSIPVQNLFELCPFVLVTGGASTGAEAVVKGCTVISLGGAFYGRTGVIHEIRSMDDVKKWASFLRVVTLTANERRAFVKGIIQNTVEGPYDFVRTPARLRMQTRQNISNLVTYLESCSVT